MSRYPRGIEKPYPAGAALVHDGKCPAGQNSPLACMFCNCGHMLECHYPMSCAEAECGHWAVAQLPDDPEDFLDPDMGLGDEPSCEYCGCTEDNACPGGCSWSLSYLQQSRFVCSRCESILRLLPVNLAALRVWMGGRLAEAPRA